MTYKILQYFPVWWPYKEIKEEVMFCGNAKYYGKVILYRYWPRQSWNITFRWTAKRVIFSQGVIHCIFPKRAALRENIITRENITILGPPTRDISSVPVNICYIRWSKWMISSKFDGALWLSRSLVTRLGVCVQTMWTQTWQLCALSIMTFYC